MDAVKIVKVPTGELPRWIREQLVGLELPLIIRNGQVKVDDDDNYIVDKKAVIASLRKCFP